MKKLLCALLALTTTFLCATAVAEEFYGALEFDRAVTVSAPFSGTAEDFDLRTGDRVSAGDTLLTLSTLGLYAPCDGTVEGLFAAPGDDADALCARYGALCSVLPSEKLLFTGTTREAYSYAQRDLTLGQIVYLKSGSGSARAGTASILSVSDSAFTAEVVSGTLRLGDQCSAYADEAMKDASKIGSGTAKKQTALPVTGSGTVLAVYAAPGDSVKAGDLLMETASGRISGDESLNASVSAPVGGVIVSVGVKAGSAVREDDPLLTIAPDGSLVAAVSVAEDDLPLIAAGDVFDLKLELDEEAYVYRAVVSSISRVNSGTAAAPSYTAYLTFENDDFVREGMRVKAIAQP